MVATSDVHAILLGGPRGSPGATAGSSLSWFSEKKAYCSELESLEGGSGRSHCGAKMGTGGTTVRGE